MLSLLLFFLASFCVSHYKPSHALALGASTINLKLVTIKQCNTFSVLPSSSLAEIVIQLDANILPRAVKSPNHLLHKKKVPFCVSESHEFLCHNPALYICRPLLERCRYYSAFTVTRLAQTHCSAEVDAKTTLPRLFRGFTTCTSPMSEA